MVATSTSLKVLTVPFGTDTATIKSLLAIPTLFRINIPVTSILPKIYREIDETQAWVLDDISIVPRRRMDCRKIFPGSDWHTLRHYSGQ